MPVPVSRLDAFLHRIRPLSAPELPEAVATEVIETNGLLVCPHGEVTHLWELTLHGITARGADLDTAIANWRRLAQGDRRTQIGPARPTPAYLQAAAS